MTNRLVALTLALFSVLPLLAAETPLVTGNSLWKYLNDGSNQGTAWREPGFNDGTWSAGVAQLGYGDGDESTFVSYGPDPGRKPITTYFRQTFQVDNPAGLASVKLRLIRDDGAVVYVNGVEVFRTNMPTGTIAYNTLAAGNSSSADEAMWHETTVSASRFVAGTNTVAVEVHQEYSGSSDMSFALELLGNDGSTPVSLRRGPYLQLGTPTSIVVRWRTDIATAGRVRYGTSAGGLTQYVDDPNVTTNHSVTLTGLSPFTTYYYSVGTPTATIAGGAGYKFLTSPEPGTSVSTKIWVLGDSGTADSSARAVRNAYYNRYGASANLWLMLGDNAYDNGTDSEFQAAVFDMYPEMLRSSVLWPTIGNHDTAGSFTYSPDIAYYDIFTLPTRGEAGGEPSGTERYYSFDYGNIHFVCLDSMTTDRSPLGPMMTWLRNDLATTNQKWIIAFWHHPPYSKGGHDSDIETPLVEMRENALPILEQYGVDLVLGGHSHSYERSYLIDGHYGRASTFVSSMKVDGGDGRTTGTGAYRKPGTNSHEGAVYAVAGSSGMASGNGPLNHPAMYISLMNLGSMVLDVNRDELHAQFLREDGSIADTFTIIKAPLPAPAAPSSLTVTTTTTSATLNWTDSSTTEDGFRVQRCTGTGCTAFVQVGTTAKDTTSFTDGNLTSSTVYRYRVLAYNGTGSNASPIADATTQGAAAPPAAPTSLTATATSTSIVNLAWGDAATDEDGYRIERCTGAGCTDFAQIAETAANATKFTNGGLTASTLYRYRVLAYNSAGVTASNVAEATTHTPLNAPTGLTATAASQSQIDLAWTDASTNESGFRVERCSGASCTGFALVTTLAANATSYADSALTASTLYRYRVVAFNGTMTATSTVAEATTKAPLTVPAAPASLTARATTTTQIDLSWTDSSANEDGFRVERCSGASCTAFAPVTTLAANATTYADAGLASSTLYRYRVVAFNGAGSAASNIAEANTQTPVPAAPSGLTATAVSPSQINLAWTDASTNETGFRVERCSGSGCTTFAAIATLAANTTSYANSGLAASTLYRYRVVATNAGGGAPSNVAEATTRPTAPAAPTSLTATSSGASQIAVRWTDNSTNEEGFRLERCTGSTCTNFVQVAQVGPNVTSLTDSGLLSSTTYRYRVLAFNVTGSAVSNIAAATTTAAVPTAPSTLTATLGGGVISLAWADNSHDETGFRVQRCAGAGCTSFVQIAQLAANVRTYNDGALASSTTYRYRVLAYNAAGTSVPSNVAEATTGPIPEAPSSLTTSSVTATSVSMRWTDNSTIETGFQIERCTGSSCTNFVQVGQVGANVSTFTSTGLVRHTVYRFRVRAVNANGGSGYSNVVNVRTTNR
ncbi:MAG TPA: fibronectin type III domain-containing protein [Thermoanaerobaculia bacterium]|jgi:fibronectin type 3 domain-containing protein